MEVIGYHKERHHWKEEFGEKVSSGHAKMIINKLARHFKLPIIRIRFYGWRDSGLASKWEGRIRLCHTPSIHVICHEVNHFLCWQKYSGVRHGTKKWCKQLQRVLDYAKRKNFWKEEFDRRNTPRPVKPEPTKKEIRLKKIEKLEKSIKKHQTRIKRCTTAMKKANRRISALRRFV